MDPSSRSISTTPGTDREELSLDVDEQRAYNAAAALLGQEANFLAPFPSVVNLRDLVEDPTAEGLSVDEMPTSLLSSNKGHHALFRALDELEGLEKEEAALIEHSPLTAPLTEVVTGRPTPSAQDALEQLEEFGSIPRRVCQHPFKRNDIVWVCRTCQAGKCRLMIASLLHILYYSKPLILLNRVSLFQRRDLRLVPLLFLPVLP